MSSTILFILSFTAALTFAEPIPQYSATYIPSDLPDQTEPGGQIGENICKKWGNGDQSSLCQTMYFNSLDDFCIWVPPYSNVNGNNTIGVTEEIEVAACIKEGYGTRLIPDGTITGAHWVQTPDFVQITGFGDFTKLGVAAGDAGGELDPHSWTGLGNPQGGVVFTSAFSQNGSVEQAHEWMSFMSATEWCFRVCKDGPLAYSFCPHQYDLMGCDWVMPGNYAVGSFDSCKGDSGEGPGSYSGSTFAQGQPVTPAAHPAIATSSCTTHASLTLIPPPSGSTIVLTSSTSTPVSTSISTSTSINSKTNSPTSSVQIPSATGSGSSRTGNSQGSSGAGKFAVTAGAVTFGIIFAVLII